MLASCLEDSDRYSKKKLFSVPNLFTHFVCLQFCTSVLQWRQVVNNSMKQHYWCDGFSLTLPPYTHVYLVIHILIKLLDLSNAFLVEYLQTAMPDISTSVLKQKNIYITDMCSCCTIAWLCKIQKGCTRLAAASDKVTNCLPMVGGSLWVLRLPPPLKLVVMI